MENLREVVPTFPNLAFRHLVLFHILLVLGYLLFKNINNIRIFESISTPLNLVAEILLIIWFTLVIITVIRLIVFLWGKLIPNINQSK
ncbi:MAG: hypothetical protein KO464_02875 [Candidatus Methanofastidiosum sp.]|nr:hypothetical protein [Methanofastidiosum sp.]